MPRSKSKYTIPVPPGMSKKQLKRKRPINEKYLLEISSLTENQELMFKAWEEQNKLIINISSSVVDEDDWGQDRLDLIEYKNQKKACQSMAQYLAKRNGKLQIRNYKITEINFTEDTKNLNSIINEFQFSKK